VYDETSCVAACEHIARHIVRPLVLRHLTTAGAIGTKSDGSLVTPADREIEAAIRAYLTERFPAFGLFGEEFGLERGYADYVWTIDPIDGTEAFVAGIATFGSLFAVVRQREGARVPLLGALYLPLQDRLLIGNAARTTLDREDLRVPQSAENVLLLGNVAKCARHMSLSQWEALRQHSLQYRSVQTWGDCLGYVNLITGKACARLEFGLGVDDVAPIEPILLGCGASVTCVDGTSISRALSSLHTLADETDFGVLCAVSRAAHTQAQRELMLI
jgi:myo-inositol-1(or 4)-monophosphatase